MALPREGQGQWLFNTGTTTSATNWTDTTGTNATASAMTATMVREAQEKLALAQTMSPDEHRRLASGFWKREVRYETGETIWHCDRRKLDREVRRAMTDPDTFDMFQRNPKRFLDQLFGEGTWEAYSCKGDGDRVAYRGKESYYDAMMYEKKQQMYKMERDFMRPDWMDEPIKTPKKKVVRAADVAIDCTIPKLRARPEGHEKFRLGKGGVLLATLQRHFDVWTSGMDKMKPEIRDLLANDPCYGPAFRSGIVNTGITA